MDAKKSRHQGGLRFTSHHRVASAKGLSQVRHHWRRYRYYSAFVIVALVLFAARLCSAADSNADRFVAPVRPLVNAALSNNFPPLGFDAPLETNSLKPGDNATMLVTQFEKGGQYHQWLILVQVVEPTARERAAKMPAPSTTYTSLGHKFQFAAEQTYVNIRTLGPFDPPSQGKPPAVEDDSARVALNTGFLGLGFDQAAAMAWSLEHEKIDGALKFDAKPFSKAEISASQIFAAAHHITPEEERATAGFGTAFGGFLDLAMQTPVLAKILFKVFDAPSAWSVLTHGHLPDFGINVNLNGTTPLDPKAWHLTSDAPLFAFPSAVMVNDKPGLLLSTAVTSPKSPFLLTGGITHLWAANPTDKERFLTLYLLGARRTAGTPAQIVAASPRPADVETANVQSNSGTNSLLSRIILIGASVTHGFTASEPFGGTNTPQFSLSRYIDAALESPHGPISNLGDSLFFTHAETSGEQQVDRALNGQPTLVVGVDFLFWSCYGSGIEDQDRLQRLDKGLELLDEFHCPIIIGDMPDASPAVGGILGANEVPGAATLAAANRRLKEWAAKRPRVTVVPLSGFMAAVLANNALTVHAITIAAGQTRALIQDDKLHPSTLGCATLALAILDKFQSSQAGLPENAVLWDPAKVLGRASEALAQEQKAAANSQ